MPPLTPQTQDETAVTRSLGPGDTRLDRILSRRFTADREAPGRARLALCGLGGRLDRSITEDVRLLVSELVTNSLRHGNTSQIRLEVWGSDDVVRIEVVDDGEGFDMQSAPQPGQAGGWGLFMVDRLTDRWGVDTAGETRVWFEVRRSGAGGREQREFFDGLA